MDATDDDGFLDRPDITDRLPRYRLINVLAKTQMSEVFLAEEAETRQRIALKVIGPEFLGRGQVFRERFKRESSIALSLKHPNVVPALDAGESADGELCFLAMRYVDGTNLSKHLHELGPLGMSTTVAIVRQVAAALDAAHQEGLVHRDVKPSNVMVESGTQHVYLCDFGVAKNHQLASLTSDNRFVGTAQYAAPEQRDSAEVDDRTDVYLLGRLIHECLSAPGAECDPRAPRIASRFGPVRLPNVPVNRVLSRAMAVKPENRHSSCEELVEALSKAHRLHLGSTGLTGALLAVVVLVCCLVIWGGPVPQEALARVPAAVRGDCRGTDASTPAAASALSCRDENGQEVTSTLFGDAAGSAAAYVRAVDRSGVSRNQGDCATANAAEHRYPATGPARGRVVCYAGAGSAVIVWTDDRARTVNRAEVPEANAASLRRAWSRWTGTAAFPTPDERALLEVAAGSECERAPSAELDAYPTAVAGVTCVPTGSGAQEVTYYRFASQSALQAAFAERVSQANSPSGVPCTTGAAPGFLGTQRHGFLGVDLGQVLCQPRPSGTLGMDWSMEPLNAVGSVVGTDPAALAGWWSEWHLAPLGRIVDALNADADPPFPTAEERELLAHVPPPSRVHCVRPSAEQRWRDVGTSDATGVACGRTSGAELVVYYQFRDVEAMRVRFNSVGDLGNAACTTLPEDFSAERPYSRADGATGRLRCSRSSGTGERILEWTDERLAIVAFAHGGFEPIAMIDWWTHDAGPI